MPEPSFFVQGTPLKDVVGVLVRYRWLVLSVAALAVCAVGAIFYLQPQTYEASTLIRVVDGRRAIAGQFEVNTVPQQIGRWGDRVLSQIQVLKSHSIAGQVVDREGLRLVSGTRGFPVHQLAGVHVAAEAEPDTIALAFGADHVVVRARSLSRQTPYGAAVDLGGVQFTVPSGKPFEIDSATLVVVPRAEAIEWVLAGLKAAPRVDTDAIDITFTFVDSVMAQRVVNGVTEVFQQHDVRMAQEQSRRRRVFLEAQLEITDSLFSEAQAGLNAFRSTARIYHSSNRINAQQQALLELDIRREELAANRRMYQSLLDRADQSGPAGRQSALVTLVSSPDIAANPVIGQLFTELIRYQSERDQLLAGPTGSTSENSDVRRLNALVADSEAKLTDAARSHVASLDARIQALDELRSRGGAEVQQMPAMESEEERLIQRVASTGQMADQVRSQLQQARMSEAVEVGQIDIVHLAPHSVPTDNNRAVKLIMAAVLGLVLGGTSAFAAEAVNTSIRRPQDVPSLLQIPRLAVIPRIEKPNRRRLLKSWSASGSAPKPARRLARVNGTAAAHGASGNGSKANGAATGSRVAPEIGFSAADAYRTLRANLMFSSRSDLIKTLMVTSASPREGKTTTASNLAVSFARQGFRVLLVDADLREPKLHEVFHMPQEPGLSSVLEGLFSPGEVARPGGVPGLHVITTGQRSINPSELLSGENMRIFLDDCRTRFDIVLLDTPPVLAAAETAVLAAEVDAVLFVVHAGQTDRNAASDAIQQLGFAGARIVGAALNDPDGVLPKYGAYQYAYGSNGGAAAG